jgi:hypothetical protein
MLKGAGMTGSYSRIRFSSSPSSEDLTNKVLAWASKVATESAQLSSKQAREEYLAERRRELVFGARAEGTGARDVAILADACVSAAIRSPRQVFAR